MSYTTSSDKSIEIADLADLGIPFGEVTLSDHKKEWEVIAQKLIGALWEMLGEYAIAIEHVGSTSIHGILAKPVLDIAVGVESIAGVEKFREVFEKKGIRIVGEVNPGQVMCDMTNERGLECVHIHILPYDSEGFQNYIDFRNYLNAFPNEALIYVKCKERLAKTFGDDRKKYTSGKNDTIKQLLMKAHAWSKQVRTDPLYKIFNEIGDGLVIFDKSGVLKYVNDKAVDILGLFGRDVSLGLKVHDLIGFTEFNDELMHIIIDADSHETSSAKYVNYKLKDGSTKTLKVSVEVSSRMGLIENEDRIVLLKEHNKNRSLITDKPEGTFSSGELRRGEKILDKIPIPISTLSEILVAHSVKVWCVGGCVRDLLFGKQPEDYDLCALGTVEELMKIFKNEGVDFDSTYSNLGYLIVTLDGMKIDLVICKGGSIENDLYTRDLTFNSLAMDMSSGEIIDPYGGQRDYYNGIVRFTNKDTLKNNPQNMIRAIRFACQYDFSIDKDSYDAMEENLSAIEDIKETQMIKNLSKLISHGRTLLCSHSSRD